MRIIYNKQLLKLFVATPKRQVVPYEMRDKLVFVFVT